ncbi:MAG: outer membrane beta-barrel protein, partial [Niastella sp.]|uniref:outer membrane beta-barrel protein n=1 Tax=Niastella sp. TaxID=1869183 RepID=UPI00389A89B7
VFVCTFMVTTRAQISKGAVWVGGSIGYNQSKNDFKDAAVKDYKNSSFNVSPAIGFVVKDNLVVGFRLNYGHDKSENYGSTSESKSNSYGGGIFVRKYIPVISRVYVFGEAGAAYAYSKGDDTRQEYVNGSYVNIKTNSKGFSTNLSVTPGLAVAITKKFQLETSLNSLLGVGYNKSKKTTERPTSSFDNMTTDQFTAGIFSDGKAQLNIGCRFLL